MVFYVGMDAAGQLCALVSSWSCDLLRMLCVFYPCENGKGKQHRSEMSPPSASRAADAGVVWDVGLQQPSLSCGVECGPG